jgi:hypothetical protein
MPKQNLLNPELFRVKKIKNVTPKFKNGLLPTIHFFKPIGKKRSAPIVAIGPQGNGWPRKGNHLQVQLSLCSQILKATCISPCTEIY